MLKTKKNEKEKTREDSLPYSQQWILIRVYAYLLIGDVVSTNTMYRRLSSAFVDVIEAPQLCVGCQPKSLSHIHLLEFLPRVGKRRSVCADFITLNVSATMLLGPRLVYALLQNHQMIKFLLRSMVEISEEAKAQHFLHCRGGFTTRCWRAASRVWHGESW